MSAPAPVSTSMPHWIDLLSSNRLVTVVCATTLPIDLCLGPVRGRQPSHGFTDPPHLILRHRRPPRLVQGPVDLACGPRWKSLALPALVVMPIPKYADGQARPLPFVWRVLVVGVPVLVPPGETGNLVRRYRNRTAATQRLSADEPVRLRSGCSHGVSLVAVRDAEHSACEGHRTVNSFTNIQLVHFCTKTVGRPPPLAVGLAVRSMRAGRPAYPLTPNPGRYAGRPRPHSAFYRGGPGGPRTSRGQCSE